MKVSEAFQKAIDLKVPQIRGQYEDDNGGYCALGWLMHKEAYNSKFCSWLKNKEGERPVDLNDDVGWSWEQFRDAALEFEKIEETKR